MRLDKYLANNGFGSRSEVKKLIASRKIRVDDEVVLDCAFQVKDGSTVNVQGSATGPSALKTVSHDFVYYMLNKPAGCVTAATDSRSATVMELFGTDRKSGLNPVGRLDKDTEGLLIVTDDGSLNHFLTSPNRNVPKKYYAILEGIPDDEGIEKLKTGVEFSDFTSKPAFLEMISRDEGKNTSEVYITVTEGKFHEVKRLALSIGCDVKYLKRVGFAGLSLDGELKPGGYRKLTADELDRLKESAGLRPLT